MIWQNNAQDEKSILAIGKSLYIGQDDFELLSLKGKEKIPIYLGLEAASCAISNEALPVINNNLFINTTSSNGDYFFHFGHFMRENLGVVHLLTEECMLGALNQHKSMMLLGPHFRRGFHEHALDLVENGLKNNVLFTETISAAPFFADLGLCVYGFEVQKPYLFIACRKLQAEYTRDIISPRVISNLRILHAKKLDNGQWKSKNEKLSNSGGVARVALLSRTKENGKSLRWANESEFHNLSIHINIDTCNFNKIYLQPVHPTQYECIEHLVSELNGFNLIVAAAGSALYNSLICLRKMHLVLCNQNESFESEGSTLQDYYAFQSQMVLLPCELITSYKDASRHSTSDFTKTTCPANNWQSPFVANKTELIAAIIDLLCKN